MYFLHSNAGTPPFSCVLARIGNALRKPTSSPVSRLSHFRKPNMSTTQNRLKKMVHLRQLCADMASRAANAGKGCD